MKTPEGMAIKYNVIKIEDIQHHLSFSMQMQLLNILETISECRKKEGKDDNTYVVINTDEPYVDQVIEMMKAHGHWG